MTARTTAATASQAVNAGASWIGLTATATAVAARCALTRKLIGHERVDVTWQLITTGAAVMVSVHVAVVGSIIGTIVASIVASIAALIEPV